MARSILQDWVQDLTLMQQSVLLSAVRSPDGLHKNNPAKPLLRWYRRCILLCSFHGQVHETADEYCGGSFTGRSPEGDQHAMRRVANDYVQSVDQVPHHFHMHLVHAAQILGYKHPTKATREFWGRFYRACVAELNLLPEPEADMDKRLGDSEEVWKAHDAKSHA